MVSTKLQMEKVELNKHTRWQPDTVFMLVYTLLTVKFDWVKDIVIESPVLHLPGYKRCAWLAVLSVGSI